MTTDEIQAELVVLKAEDKAHSAALSANSRRRQELREGCPHPETEQVQSSEVGWITCKICEAVRPKNPVVTGN